METRYSDVRSQGWSERGLRARRGVRNSSRIGIAALIIAGCATPMNQPSTVAGVDAPPRDLLLRFERTSCLGTCPVYLVEVDEDGAVRYEGRANVCTPGKISALLAPSVVSDLRRAIAESHFMTTPEHCCDCPIADTPSVVVTVADKGSRKTIVDSAGCQAPTSVRDLEHSFEKLLGTERWTGTKEERKNCAW